MVQNSGNRARINFMKTDPLALVKEAIEKKIPEAGNQPFAVFDFDNTCIINDIGEAVFAYLCRNKLLKNSDLLAGDAPVDGEYSERVFRHYYNLLEQGKTREAYIFCAQVLAGFTPAEAESLVRTVIESEVKNLSTTELYGISIAHGLVVRHQVLQLIDFLESKNVSIWIVSASSEIAVRAAMKHFRIPGNLIGLKNKIQDGVFTSALEPPLSILEEKVTCIKTIIDRNNPPLLAAGDSPNDLAMLELAMIKVVIDRGNSLVKKARSRGWFIFSYV